ncbi:MAG: hypothetical protein WDZ96_00190 [Acidimicrobiia bacterium]
MAIETQPQDSDLVRDLRAQIKAKNQEIKELQAVADGAEDKARQAILLEQELEAFGQPKSVLQIVKEQLGDEEVTSSSVEDALIALGFNLKAPEPDNDGVGDYQAPQPVGAGLADSLSAVTSLGNQVAAAARNSPHSNLTDQINSAETPEQLAAIMREAGQGT